ncbi:MAG: GUN4 domain-containing protein [Pseudanabaenaceae cyanobacterium bins.39]|nr:GUN4 domain-containing protein [Pseudanabaenaceae cyanobacterium bins.39]
MPYCLSPQCQNPVNPAGSKFCCGCGRPLQLKGLYEPIALIGQGGMGRTFRGVDLGRLGQPCAIKQFFPSFLSASSKTLTNPIDLKLREKAIALFAREAEQLRTLGNHPQIPELIAYFWEEDCWYLVQELIEGENLESLIQGDRLSNRNTSSISQRLFSEEQIYELLWGILPVLEFIHGQRVIHRDIKPANIIRRSPQNNRNLRGEAQEFVLVDFGAAKVWDLGQKALTATLIGSAEYMAPEQAKGKALPQSDLYSLGVTCIYLLTGRSPFDLYDDENDRWQWQSFLSQPISLDLTMILNRLLQKAIASRYHSATEVLEDLSSRSHNQVTSIASIGNGLDKLNGLDRLDRTNIDLVKLKELENLLSLGQWQAGDQLTNSIILEQAHRSRISQITAEDIDRIPCELWLAIDQMWIKYSNNHFGWTVQSKIWTSLGGKLLYDADIYWEFAIVYQKFADRLGWRRSLWLNLFFLPKVWRRYENLNFAIAAPYGHLPTLLFWEGFNLVDSLFYRLQICKR